MPGSVSGTSSSRGQRLSREILVSQLASLWLAAFFVSVGFAGIAPANGQTPATIGQFSSVMTWPYQAVHAHLLPAGKVLWWPAFANGDNPTIWNPSDRKSTRLNSVASLSRMP